MTDLNLIESSVVNSWCSDRIIGFWQLRDLGNSFHTIPILEVNAAASFSFHCQAISLPAAEELSHYWDEINVKLYVIKQIPLAQGCGLYYEIAVILSIGIKWQRFSPGVYTLFRDDRRRPPPPLTVPPPPHSGRLGQWQISYKSELYMLYLLLQYTGRIGNWNGELSYIKC